jgi:hypothetical protein
VVLCIKEGFYFFGREIATPEGYITLADAAMFDGYEGSGGVFGVAKGSKDAKVKLNLLAPDQKAVFPIDSVIGIFDSIALYEFNGTKTA